MGGVLDKLHREDEALKELQLAQELDPNPLTVGTLIDLVRSISFQRKYHDQGQPQAIGRLRKALKYDQENGYLHLNLYEIYADNGMDDAAIKELQRAAFLYGYKELAAHIADVYAKAGAKPAMRLYATELEQINERRLLWRPTMVAEAYARAGDREKAWRWLYKSFELRDFQLVDAITNPSDKLVTMFQSDPRFKQMLQRTGLSQ